MRNRELLEEFRRSYGDQKLAGRKKAIAPGPSRRIVLVGGAATVIAAGIFGVVATQKPPTEEPIPNLLRIILLDSSDRNPASTDRNITQYLERHMVDDLREGDRLVLLELTANVTEPVIQHFNAVSPARGEDVSGLFSDPYQAEETWQSSFKDLYVSEARSMRQVLEKAQTPFLEGMMAISSILRAYPAKSKEVYAISDALQHVNNGGLTAYRDANSSRSVYKMPAQLTEFYQPDFLGAKISVLHIQRNNLQHRQGEVQKRWLRDIFENYNAKFDYVAI